MKKFDNIQFVVNMKLESPVDPFNTAIIAKANTPEQPSVRVSSVELERIRTEWNKENNYYKFSLVLPRLPENTDEVLIFLFNKKQVPYKIVEAKTLVYVYD